MSHWHVSSGLCGYGPDGGNGEFLLSEDPEGLAQLIFDELDSHMDLVWDTMIAVKDHGGFQEAWRWFDLHQELYVIRQSFSPDRSSAPLYRDRQELWHETIMSLVTIHFPLDLNPEGTVRLYVWDCAERACDKEV